jgi:hypothetical protein
MNTNYWITVRNSPACCIIARMATTWTVHCESSGSETELKLEDAILNDTWTAVIATDWDVPEGKIANFGQPILFLGNGTGTPH